MKSVLYDFGKRAGEDQGERGKRTVSGMIREGK